MFQRVLVRPGGLLRCCALTLVEKAEASQLPELQGSITECKYCSEKMVLIDDAWEWLNSDRGEDCNDRRPIRTPKECTN